MRCIGDRTTSAPSFAGGLRHRLRVLAISTNMYDINPLWEELLKIKSLQARVCNAEMRNWIFVRVETGQPGLIGWDEFKTRAVIGAIADIEPILVNQDPRNIEHCF